MGAGGSFSGGTAI